MFSDGYFADLYAGSARGRPTVPARVVATVMLLQAFEGLSDREACDRLEFDLRWQAAAGADAGCRAFHPTVLVGMRGKLRAWARVYAASLNGSVLDQIRQTADGGYIAVGSITDSRQYTGALILKLDGAGNVQWQKNLGPGGTNAAYFESVQQ